jgi:hypothetical protein
MIDALERKKRKLHKLVDRLPPERLDGAEGLLEPLCYEAPMKMKQGRRIMRLGGLWKDLGIEITGEDTARRRKER